MKRDFTVMLIATACVVGSTPGFARGGVVHHGKFGGQCPSWVNRYRSTGPRRAHNVRFTRWVQPIDATPSNLA